MVGVGGGGIYRIGRWNRIYRETVRVFILTSVEIVRGYVGRVRKYIEFSLED